MVSSAEDGDEVANKILHDSVQELADSVVAVVRRLKLCGEGSNSAQFVYYSPNEFLDVYS